MTPSACQAAPPRVAITGPDLAATFGARLGKDVAFEPITPEEFRVSVAPLIGEGPPPTSRAPTGP